MLLQFARAGSFELVLSEPILAETADVLLTRQHLRRRYKYADQAVTEYTQGLAQAATMATNLPALTVVRDPADDMILATAVAAGSEYLVTRDKDLLDLGEHAGIKIVPPEDFLAVVRKSSSQQP